MSIKNIAWKKIDIALAGALVALVAVLSWYAWVQYVPGFGVLRMDSLAAPSYIADAVTISADGTQVAILHQEIQMGQVRSWLKCGTSSRGSRFPNLPCRGQLTMDHAVLRPLAKTQFLRWRKYLLAFAPPDRLYLADAHTFTMRDPIHLSALRLRAEGDPGNSDPPPGTPVPSGPVEFDCAASSGVAVLGFSEGLNVAVALLFVSPINRISRLSHLWPARNFLRCDAHEALNEQFTIVRENYSLCDRLPGFLVYSDSQGCGKPSSGSLQY